MAYNPKTPHDLEYGKERLSDVKTHSGQTADIVGPNMAAGNQGDDVNISEFGTTTCSGNDVLKYQAHAEPGAGRRYKVGSG